MVVIKRCILIEGETKPMEYLIETILRIAQNRNINIKMSGDDKNGVS